MEKKIFSDVKFYLIGFDSSKKIEETLLSNGAQKHHYLSDIVTHCIAKDYDDEVAEARDLYQLKVVNEKWVHCSLQCQMSLPTKTFEIQATPEIFKDLKFYFLELSDKDSRLLWALIGMNGGKVFSNMSSHVTHLITNSHTNTVKSSPGSPYTVHSNWVLESHKQQIKLSETEYKPDFFESVVKEKESGNGKEEKMEDSMIKPRIEEHASFVTNQKKSLFSSSCSKESFWLSKGIFGEHMFHIEDYRGLVDDEELLLWRQLIKAEGGSIAESYTRDVTHVLCSHQHSQYYLRAIEDAKEVRTAYWLNDCLVCKAIIKPHAFLHLPYHPSFRTLLDKHVICTTNLRGYDKVVFKRVVHLLGALYTPHLTKNNTMLVFKTRDGKKFEKTDQWGIPTISLESFFKNIQPAFLHTKE